MSEPVVASRMLTQRRELGRLTPRRFTQTARWRFNQDRRQIYLRRLGGQADEQQAGIIDAAVACEWQAKKLEAEAERAETAKERYERLRLAAEYRRQWLLLDRDLVRATRQPPLPPEKPKTLADHLAAKAAEREGVAR